MCEKWQMLQSLLNSEVSTDGENDGPSIIERAGKRFEGAESFECSRILVKRSLLPMYIM